MNIRIKVFLLLFFQKKKILASLSLSGTLLGSYLLALVGFRQRAPFWNNTTQTVDSRISTASRRLRYFT